MRNIIIIRDNVAVFVPIAPGRRFVSATTSSAALCQSKQRSSVDKQSLSQPFSIATIKRSKDPKIQRLQRSKDSRTASTSLSPPPPSLPSSNSSIKSIRSQTAFIYFIQLLISKHQKPTADSWVSGAWKVAVRATTEQVISLELCKEVNLLKRSKTRGNGNTWRGPHHGDNWCATVPFFTTLACCSFRSS